jgi:hypothetical protein
MISILHRNRDLPRDRAELYDKCSELLLYQWKSDEALRADPDLAQDAGAIGIKEKKGILRLLAREMQAGSKGSSEILYPEILLKRSLQIT